MSPDELGILIVFLLKLVDGLRSIRSEAWQQRKHVEIRRQVRDGWNLIFRDRVVEDPAEVVAVVVLIVAPQIGIVFFAVVMMVRLSERRRLNAAVCRHVAVQHVKTEFFSDRSAVFKRGIDRLI